MSEENLKNAAEQALDAVEEASAQERPADSEEEIGRVSFVGQGVVRATGLPNVQSEELVRFENGKYGSAFTLGEDEVSIVLLDDNEGISGGQEVRRTGRVLDVPVGEALLGRVVDPLARPLDDEGPVETDERLPAERPAPPIVHRAPVDTPLQTGVQVVDAVIPVGRGQRELILGDRQTGKTAIAVDAIINQRNFNVRCIYCAIGKRSSAVAKVIADLREHDALEQTTVVMTTEDDPPGINYIAPYTATSMAEYFVERGEDVLIVYDDLTRHARSYRELSLLLRRPPSREAYPGDIFYIHSRLLERATHLRDDYGGGSLTALPIIETQAQNISAYIPTNLISITDGQIFVSPKLFQRGQLPAVDVGQSVSRVGGDAQLPAYQEVAGQLRLSFSQFEELESFARFGVRLDPETRRRLERGRRIREVLKQEQYSPIPVPRQIGELYAVTAGLLDEVPIDRMGEARKRIYDCLDEKLAEIASRIAEGAELSEKELEKMKQSFGEALEPLQEG
jgi:F-type H+-transporting ATPase subunit alpha